MRTVIRDDFDLGKIAFCGQCFRAKEYDDGTFRFVTGEETLYIRREGDGAYSVSCTEENWREVWRNYFDLDRDYEGLRKRTRDSCGGSDFIRKAAECGRGLRVLRQDPWEMIVTFIISQRKNIPAIAKAVELLAEKYGHPAEAGNDSVYAFPTPEELGRASETDLRACGLGYRAAYVRDAADKVLSGELDLEALRKYGDEELFRELMKVRGVGVKVANCVCLFGYGRTGRAPVDVWISRAIREHCGGRDPFPDYGEDAGIIQQYVFFYMRETARRRERPDGPAFSV